jgi:hypothetical protein
VHLTPAQRDLRDGVRALAGTWGSQSHHRARIMASLTAASNRGGIEEEP